MNENSRKNPLSRVETFAARLAGTRVPKNPIELPPVLAPYVAFKNLDKENTFVPFQPPPRPSILPAPRRREGCFSRSLRDLGALQRNENVNKILSSRVEHFRVLHFQKYNFITLILLSTLFFFFKWSSTWATLLKSSVPFLGCFCLTFLKLLFHSNYSGESSEISLWLSISVACVE